MRDFYVLKIVLAKSFSNLMFLMVLCFVFGYIFIKLPQLVSIYTTTVF